MNKKQSPRFCKLCGNEFQLKINNNKIFCSNKCAVRFHNERKKSGYLILKFFYENPLAQKEDIRSRYPYLSKNRLTRWYNLIDKFREKIRELELTRITYLNY